MRHKLSLRALDIAPDAPRYSKSAWGMLAGGALLALVSGWFFGNSAVTMHEAYEQRAAKLAKLEAIKSRDALEKQRQSDPANLSQLKGQQQLIANMRTSWSGLLEALEVATVEVRGGVSVMSITPASSLGETMQVSVKAIASSAKMMLLYVETLQGTSPIGGVELVTQLPDEQIGPGVVRFQLTVSWRTRTDRGSKVTGSWPMVAK